MPPESDEGVMLCDLQASTAIALLFGRFVLDEPASAGASRWSPDGRYRYAIGSANSIRSLKS